jgi:hypothetical protein
MWVVTAICVVTFALLGVSVIVSGRAVVREYGPETRMRFPLRRGVVEEWIQEQTGAGTTSARNMVRIGWLMVFGSLGYIPAFHWDAINPMAIHRRANSACRTLVTAEEIFELTGRRAELAHIVDEGRHCRARWEDDRGAVFELEIGPGGSFPAGSLRDRREWEARRSHPREIRELGEHALWMLESRRQTVYADLGVPVCAVVEGEVSQAELDRLVKSMRSRRFTLTAMKYARR